jgi:hypothetical protein
MFTMDTNGTLRTAMSFDYESYQSLSIRVAVLDDNNASAEGAFSVMVTNVNETPTTLDHSSALSVLENQGERSDSRNFYCPGSGWGFINLPHDQRNWRWK